MQRAPHQVIWDDASAVGEVIDAGEMMQRLACVLDGDLAVKSFRGEPRYEIRRSDPAGYELSVIAGHINDDREVLSLAIELWPAGGAAQRPLTSAHLSNGVERVKASRDTAWLRARNGTVVIVGAGLGGLIEVQN